MDIDKSFAQTIDATAGNQAWITPTSVLAVTVMILVKMCTNTLKIEDEDSDSEV